MEPGRNRSGDGSSSNTNNDRNNDNNKDNNRNNNTSNVGVLAEYKTDAIRGILAAQSAERNKEEQTTQTSAHDSDNNDNNLSDCKQDAVRDILAAHSARRDREDSKLQASGHISSLHNSSHHQTSALAGSNGAGNLSDHKSAAIQEIIAAQSVHSDRAEKKLAASVHGSSFHSSSHHRAAATAADAVAAAKEQARNTTARNLGAWAVIERGRNVSITPRDMVGRNDYNRGLHEMDNGRSIESINYSEGEGEGYSDSEGEGDQESFFDHPDVDYDEEEAANEEGLARAFAVQEDDDDEIDPSYLPAGLEFDPDAKPPELIHRQNRYRAVRFYCFVATGLVAIALVGFAVAWQFHTTVIEALPDREVLGIREYVVGILSSLSVAETALLAPTNPYRLAFEWIQNVDTLALTPHNGTKFTQRFLTAYLYFATSVDCGPATTVAFPDANNDNSCVHVFKPTSLYGSVVPDEIAGTRWLGSDDECTWGGVTCDLNGNVQMLDLRGSNMTGSFPVGISGLPFLRELLLSYGGLAGPLPTVLGAMKHLSSVVLFGNQFTGNIPDSWYQSRSLNYVDVGGNKLTGTISESVVKWKDVRALLINENGLSGSIPSAMGEMKSLYDFSAGYNAITGTIPASLMMNHLEFLTLDHNKIIGKIPTEIGRTSLTWLSIQHNQLNSTVPTEMSLLSDLWGFDVSNNQLTGSIDILTNITGLELVRINDNQFNGTLPQALGGLKKMQEFAASGNNFVGAVPRKICKLRSGEGKRDVTGELTVLQLGCSVPIGAKVAEISCPDGCCTACCDTDGKNCQTVISD